jgi:hypothetical protein
MADEEAHRAVNLEARHIFVVAGLRAVVENLHIHESL